MFIFAVFRSVIALGVCVGILSMIIVIMGWFMCKKRRRRRIKRKRSDGNFVYYNPCRESAEILEGFDHLEQLKRRVLAERLASGIEREVEDLSFLTDDKDEFLFTQCHQTIPKEIACS